MPYTAYPTPAALEDLLQSAGIVPTAAQATQLQRSLDAARREFESRIGYVMLASATPYERRFTPPEDDSGVLWLDVPLSSLSSFSYQPTGSTAETLAVDTDYVLRPQNAGVGAVVTPYTSVWFPSRRWWSPLSSSLYGSLRITGVWGYTVLPADAWDALVRRAALLMFPAVSRAATGGRTEWRSADRMERYGDQPDKSTRDLWASDYNGAVNRYRRLVL